MVKALSIALALSAAASGAALAETGPTLRVGYGDLDLSRKEDAQAFARRVKEASAAFCEDHRATVTPDAVGAPEVCRRGMADLAVSKLPEREWRDFARNEGFRTLRKAG